MSNIQPVSGSMFEIESGKPIPPDPRKKYPFDQMEVGDSFFVPLGDNEQRVKKTVSNCARSFGKRVGQRFSIRSDGDGIRIWRVL